MNTKDRRVCFSPEGFGRFLSVLNRRFGSAGDSILYSMAREFGIYDTKQMLALLKSDSSINNEASIVSELLDSITSFGWGQYKIGKFDLLEGEIEIIVKDNPTLVNCNKTNSSQCFFVKGVLSGIIKEATEIEFHPSKHICQDDNNTCQFSFTR